MTLFRGDSLVVSLPGAEVGQMLLPGSLAEPEVVLANPLSLELRSALEILQAEARRRALPMKCVARPEMFTHGIAEAWLRGRVSPLAQHVCLSDGSTVKYLPGLSTHVFFYCQSFRDSAIALQRLSRRAPELLTGLRSQINTWLIFGRELNAPRPKPVYVLRERPLQLTPPTLLPFFLNRDSAEDSANRIERAGPVATPNLAGFNRMMYVPLTETGLDNRPFARAVARMILRTFFDPITLLVLRLPASLRGEHSLVRGITTLLAAVCGSGVVLPRSSPPNILFTELDLNESHTIFDQFPFQMIVHDSFDFWRHTVHFYARASEVTVLANQEAATSASLSPLDVSAIYGPNAVRRSIVDLVGPD